MRLTSLLVATAALVACGATDRSRARPTGPIADTADIIAPRDEAALDRSLRAFQARSGVALVVATVPSLGGETIERTAFDLFNRWGIGDAATHRGLLILVAPSERQVRIEVGCGLQRAVTDARAAAIIETDMLPKLRTGALAAGIVVGADATMRTTLAHRQEFNAQPLSPACLRRAA